MTTIEQFVAALKAHLTKYQSTGYGTHPIEAILTAQEFGNTDSWFYDVDVIDLDKLFAEIDKFAATFKP